MRNKMARDLFPKRRFRSDILHSQIGTREKNGAKSSIWEQYVPFADRNSEQNGAKCPIVEQIMEQTVPFADGNSDQNSPKFGPK